MEERRKTKRKDAKPFLSTHYGPDVMTNMKWVLSFNLYKRKLGLRELK